MIYDTFMFNDELDMLECRLTELQDVPDLQHVLVESLHDHRGRHKLLYFADNRGRFAAWADRVLHVIARALPDSPDPWVRENAQREYAGAALRDVSSDDVILHGDVDEIPTVEALTWAVGDLQEPAVLRMRLCNYAADWLYPEPWNGTIAARPGHVASFSSLRAQRNSLPHVPGAGSHLSWMGGTEAHQRKLACHCHLEMTQAEHDLIASGRAYWEGMHHSGVQMAGVDVDETWPAWVWKRQCPLSWFRPRKVA